MAEERFEKFYTVSRLTREIKNLLEEKYPFIWVSGEISNYSVPASGHSYFTLKDENAVIQAVMFKNQKRGLKFNPENGMKIFGLARLTLYEPRGNYQLIFEHIEPDGTGSLQIAYEQLKARLAEKGYFDEKHKKQIPFLPAKICVITSGTGAAVKDILHVLTRRYPNIEIDIIPVKVQGEDAPQQVCRALELAQEFSLPDVIILARGGGSLEDLYAFNTEAVAASIYKCSVPVITGIGHETDYTIADFTADLRAPTPSAAAEMCVPEKLQLAATVQQNLNRLNTAVEFHIHEKKRRIADLSSRLRNPDLLVYDALMHIEDLSSRLDNAVKSTVKFKGQQFSTMLQRFFFSNPSAQINSYKDHVLHLHSRLELQTVSVINNNKARLSQAQAKLEALSPMSILNRGYSITRRCRDNKLVSAQKHVKVDESVEIIVSDGKIKAKVEKTYG